MLPPNAIATTDNYFSLHILQPHNSTAHCPCSLLVHFVVAIRLGAFLYAVFPIFIFAWWRIQWFNYYYIISHWTRALVWTLKADRANGTSLFDCWLDAAVLRFHFNLNENASQRKRLGLVHKMIPVSGSAARSWFNLQTKFWCGQRTAHVFMFSVHVRAKIQMGRLHFMSMWI